MYPVPPVPRKRGQLRAGLRYAASVPAIIRPLLMMALVGTFTFEFEVSLPLLASTTFHGTDTTYNWLLGGLGAGAVAGGIYAARSVKTGVRRFTWAALGYAITVGLLTAAPTLPTPCWRARWPARPASCSSPRATRRSSSPCRVTLCPARSLQVTRPARFRVS